MRIFTKRDRVEIGFDRLGRLPACATGKEIFAQYVSVFEKTERQAKAYHDRLADGVPLFSTEVAEMSITQTKLEALDSPGRIEFQEHPSHTVLVSRFGALAVYLNAPGVPGMVLHYKKERPLFQKSSIDGRDVFGRIGENQMVNLPKRE